MKILKYSIICFCLLSIAGCAIFQSKENWDIEKSKSIKSKIEKFNKGTTDKEVIEIFGVPDYRSEKPHYISYNYKKISYETVLGGGGGLGSCYFGPMPRFYIDDYKTLTLLIDFDDHWKFEGYEILK